ncbi:MAG: hypothetical protein LBC88_04115 [Spirochaetaceae bacterium]|jgi:hypothetical protein|nr:hypothetical protein [Spirochaetaceae bacterium]
MSIVFSFRIGQAALTAALLLLSSCRRQTVPLPVIPPPTPPLSRPVIGYGVIRSTYTRVSAEPGEPGLSLGYLRQGSIVEVLERRSVARNERAESWVFVLPSAEAGGLGWIEETVISIYTNRSQAETAAGGLSR